MRLIHLGSFLLGFVPMAASASPMVSWGTTDQGIYASATNLEDKSWNCSGTYTLTVNGMSSEESVSFFVKPNSSGLVVYARTINLPRSQWRFSGGDISCS